MNERRLDLGADISTPPRCTANIYYLLCIFMQWNTGSNRQNISLGVRLVLVVEADGAVGAKVIGASRFCRTTALDAVHSAAGHHVPVAIDDQIDFLGGFVV